MANNSEYKITYLLGAGASANALPIVKNITDKDGNIIKYGLSTSLRHLQDYLLYEKSIASEHKEFVEEISSDLIWLADKSDEFITTDTFAKYLYLKEKDREKLKRLKRALSFYFSKAQVIDKNFDNRALAFLTSILQNDYSFPSNIKILSWNYDYQIQIAASEFRKVDLSPIRHRNELASPLINHFPVIGNEQLTNYDKGGEIFSMVHLNGIAGFKKEKKDFIDCLFSNDYDDINSLINDIKTQEEKSLLTFAWEKNTYSAKNLNNRVRISKKMISNSDILVVIGYSFPFFNRKIDAAIFEELKSNENFKKIYFQDPYRKGEFLRKQFDLSDKIEIEHIDWADNYFIPNEL